MKPLLVGEVVRHLRNILGATGCFSPAYLDFGVLACDAWLIHGDGTFRPGQLQASTASSLVKPPRNPEREATKR